MKKTFLDTSYVVALVNRQDEFHERANQLVEIYENTPLLVTDAVLLEIGNSLARNHKPHAITLFQKFFTSSDIEIVRLDESLFGRAFELYQQYLDKPWGLVDCVSFVVMRDHGLTEALTHDSNYVQAGFVAVMREFIN